MNIYQSYTYRKYLKLVSAIFLSNFKFLPNDSPLKAMKNVFVFHLKSSFRSWGIQVFVFPSSPCFLPVSHCSRGWSKVNLKVYDIINFLTKNLIIHFVWYLEKEKSYDIETLSIDRVLYKRPFYGNIMQKKYIKI